ncbi:phosphoglucosamine mutase, partial [bacterium]|nr:phosphoglucosamine mutase [bacterium]
RTQDAVLKYRADVGISLDGDADRVIMVDEKGEILNGDHILAICAIFLKNSGRLKSDKVVATQMSNVGFDLAMKAHGISVVRTDVGDKYVVEAMRAENLVLGGEQSGHIIHLDHATTGDGCVAALNVLSVMRETKKPLSELRKIMTDVPQVLINTKVSKRVDLTQVPGFQDKISEIEAQLNGTGRVFVRMSGTEPVVRILVEGPDERRISSLAGDIAEFLQKHVS